MNQKRCCFDYSKLRGKIIEKYHTQIKFADAYDISRQAMSNKLNNKTYFSASDIMKMSNMLDIDANEINSYFFTQKI